MMILILVNSHFFFLLILTTGKFNVYGYSKFHTKVIALKMLVITVAGKNFKDALCL